MTGIGTSTLFIKFLAIEKKTLEKSPKNVSPQSFSKAGIIRFVQRGDTVKWERVATGGKYKIQVDDDDDDDDYDT